MPRLLVLAFFLCMPAYALMGQGAATINVHLDLVHETNGVRELDRSVFFNTHASPYEPEWRGEEDKLEQFMDEFNGHFGRDTGTITQVLHQVREDPRRPGYADPAHLKELIDANRRAYQSRPVFHRFAEQSDLVIAAQLHPYWPDGKYKTRQGWALSTADTSDEPLGTATGEYMGRYLKQFFGRGGPPRPNYVEVINEPLWHLSTLGDTDPRDVFRFHNTVAEQIRKYNGDKIKIGGYTMAFPWFENDNFQRWEKRFKTFIDMCGEHMDFYSIHLYDFPSINNGQVKLLTGSTIEATFDLIDHYSQLKLGHQKPYVISEYGSMHHDWARDPWMPYLDWLHNKSANGQIMQFLDRPDLMAKTINFSMPKAEWGWNTEHNFPYRHRIMRRVSEGDRNPNNNREGPWVWSDQIQFFQLWSDMRGTRLLAQTSNLDLQTHAYTHGKSVHVAINNLDDEKQKVRIAFHGTDGDSPTRATVKNHFLQGENGKLKTKVFKSPPQTLTLQPGATMVVEYRFPNSLRPDKTAREIKAFADDYLQPIQDGAPVNFEIPVPDKGEYGVATLRLGVGRDHGHARFPSQITLNGQALEIPTNFRGDDSQADRTRFFGLLEVPVPFDLLKESNAVTLTFPDTNGHVSSAALRIFNTDAPLP
ncbi:MAG: agarase [Planctomycetota bacterium]